MLNFIICDLIKCKYKYNKGEYILCKDSKHNISSAVLHANNKQQNNKIYASIIKEGISTYNIYTACKYINKLKIILKLLRG